MSASETRYPILQVVFFANASGDEPVRSWLMDLPQAARHAIGVDIKTAQYGWPLGMPLVRKLRPTLWEVRSRVAGGNARVLFTVRGQTMVLLHGFIKKSGKTPATVLKTAERRLVELLDGDAR